MGGESTERDWTDHVLPANGHQMAWYEIGRGPTVVCLHGSYDHLLYRPMAERFVDAYLEAGGYRRHIPDAQGLKRGMELDGAHRISAPTMVLYGYQDYEPITQAYLIKEHIPQTRITFFNECGHMVWLDQPEAFRESLSTFIDSADGQVMRD